MLDSMQTKQKVTVEQKPTRTTRPRRDEQDMNVRSTRVRGGPAARPAPRAGRRRERAHPEGLGPGASRFFTRVCAAEAG